jgi:hypothetical protein
LQRVKDLAGLEGNSETPLYMKGQRWNYLGICDSVRYAAYHLLAGTFGRFVSAVIAPDYEIPVSDLQYLTLAI